MQRALVLYFKWQSYLMVEINSPEVVEVVDDKPQSFVAMCDCDHVPLRVVIRA